MKAFVNKIQFRKSSESLKEDDEFFLERKQLNSLHSYFSHSLLYLERLEDAIKNINIMISDLNRSLMLFFEQEVHLDIVKHVSYILDSFSDVREKTTSRIAKSRVLVNNTLDKIKKLQSLCIKKKNLGSSIDHYEKKIRKLQMVPSPNQKHLDKIIRNQHKLNIVKTDFLQHHEYIKKGFDIVLENKTHKVLFDARKDLELLLSYFSLMNSVSLKLKDPLKELKFKYQDVKSDKFPVEYNFFQEEEDRMNIFADPKKFEHRNPFNQEFPRLENKNYKHSTSENHATTAQQTNEKKENGFFKIKSLLGVNDKSVQKVKSLSSPNITPIFPQ
ncbi:conserved Plasmodium protein, unknown function [Plasmodium reichenowi]|uniref:Uncharacterized protein n=1 Tax=Plasmodium reichenowi TaxID=5854 RepID=A0A060S3M7_PLARE|nr:hypothetical protein PRSY57_1364700 [Plasmodium reichenowi]KYN95065.1 hypothetical protein PRSY57_1364700 [Plasmodium reichenowi]CDO66437.1 conserved Plasmodium protein, unknown function [Plasmodium reichenowi]SOV82283.1 conserved Plasmodium protein, unknown function [Plasmodium reichenowi]